MKIALFIILIVFSVFTQTAILPYLHLGHWTPNIALITTIYFGLFAGFFRGYIFGFFVGILVDIFSGGILGINSFILTLLGALSGSLNQWVIIQDIKTQTSAILTSTIVHGFILMLFLKLFDYGVSIITDFIRELIPQSLVHLVIACLIYYIMKSILRIEPIQNDKL
jgi:rod shape-determining protein MreD